MTTDDYRCTINHTIGDKQSLCLGLEQNAASNSKNCVAVFTSVLAIYVKAISCANFKVVALVKYSLWNAGLA